MAGEREPNIDEVLRKLQIKEQKRSGRPIQLYTTAYDHEEERIIREKFLSDTPAAKQRLDVFANRFFEQTEIDEEIGEKARADLTPEEREQEEIGEILSDLKNIPTMSGKINYMEDTVNLPLRFKLISHDEKFMTPIIIGTMKRPYRRAKAQEAVERILQKRRGEDQPHE